jgi:uncharacterized membrane protein YdjX (TVP38/TMEM64 family)
MKKRSRVKLVEFEMWRYRYIVMYSLSLIVTFFIFLDPTISALVSGISSWSYLGVLVTGVFYVHSLSAPPAAATILLLSKSLAPFPLIILATIGATIGDFFLFKFMRADIVPEARLLAEDLRVPRIKSPEMVHWIHKLAPYIAGFIIASPLPDEVGAALFGAIEYDTKKFVIVSFICHLAGITALVLLGRTLF